MVYASATIEYAIAFSGMCHVMLIGTLTDVAQQHASRLAQCPPSTRPGSLPEAVCPHNRSSVLFPFLRLGQTTFTFTFSVL